MPRPRHPLSLVLTALVLVSPLAACGGEEETTLTVLAAASLTDSYEELGEQLEADHEGVEVRFSFGSSTDLAEQAVDGAPGDVLATADETSMQPAADAGVLEGDPVRFATNTIVLVVPAANPAGIDTLDDLADATWVRCADEVPCGRVAVPLIEANGVSSEPASLEEDVRSTLDKVVSGEADAGFVYATDAVAAGDAVETLEVPGAGDAPTSYLTAALEQAAEPDLAGEWVDLVTGEEGQAVLAEAGFTTP